jgi:energy-coupling factor transporter ATP-binding protein EcfA2
VIRRIRLKDYMSHADTTIELADGLTVLVGPNNCGKSAVVAALEAVARNQLGDFMIRHGAKGCEVTVETDDGRSVTWRRRSAPSYVIDGVEHARVRGSVPEDVHRILRMPLVSAEDERLAFDIHFARQKAPIFLLDAPGSQAAAFFAASSDASRLIEMQRRHREKVTERRREQARVRAEIARIEREEAALAPVAGAGEALAGAEAERRAIESEAAAIERLEALVERLRVTEGRRAAAAARARALGALGGPPALEPDAQVEGAARALARLDAALASARGRAGAAARLRPPPPVEPETEVGQAVRAIGRAHALFASTRRAAAALGALRPVPAVAEEAPLEAAIRGLVSAARSVRKAAGEVAAREAELARTAAEVAAWAAAHPSCPLCGGAVEAGRLLGYVAGGCAHG